MECQTLGHPILHFYSAPLLKAPLSGARNPFRLCQNHGLLATR